MRNNYIDPLEVKDIHDYSPREQIIQAVPQSTQTDI